MVRFPSPSGTLRIAAALAAAFAFAALGGCTEGGENDFVGSEYRSKSWPVKGDRQAFLVVVSGAEAGSSAPREAARYRATQYCLGNFGTSDIDWTVGPETPDEGQRRWRGGLVFYGRCRIW